MKTRLLLAAALGGLGLLCACQTASRPSASALPLTGTEWVLIELNGKPITLSEGLSTPTVALDIAKKQASGTSGINRYAGPYELVGNSLKFGPLMGTRRAGPPEAMAQEEAFLAAMGEVTGWSIAGERLTLKTQGKSTLRFQKHP